MRVELGDFRQFHIVTIPQSQYLVGVFGYRETHVFKLHLCQREDFVQEPWVVIGDSEPVCFPGMAEFTQHFEQRVDDEPVESCDEPHFP